MSLGAHISYFKLYQLQREKYFITELLYFHIFVWIDEKLRAREINLEAEMCEVKDFAPRICLING